jgi:hypothetical protein
LTPGVTYFFAAKSVDSLGGESVFSNEVSCSIPAIALVSPLNGASAAAPANVNLAANVVSNGHTVNQVQFHSGSTLIGQAMSAPYRFAWTNVGAGLYGLSAWVVYDGGNVATSPAASMMVTNPPPPTLSSFPNLTTPVNTPTPPIPFTVSDKAVPLSNLTVSVTVAFNGQTKVGSVSVGGSGANRTLTITPVAGVEGLTAVTVTVSDGIGSSSQTFLLNVGPGSVNTITDGGGTINQLQFTGGILTGVLPQ